MNNWDDYMFFGVMILIGAFGCVGIGYAAYQHNYHPTLYTVRHGENIHRNARIGVTESGVINGTDSDGRRFMYRDGWEAIQEESR